MGTEGKGILGSLDPTGVINAVGSVIGQGIANRQQRWNIRTQNKYDKERAAKQFEYDTTAWNRTNQYNSPSQVMERYKAAGLNPNLIYGGGVGNTAGTAPSQKAPEQQMAMPNPVDIGGVLGNYQNAKLQQVQTNNAIKQGELLDKQKLIKAAEAESAINYYFGRAQGTRAKGLMSQKELAWQLEYDPEFKEKFGTNRIRGFTMRDTQQDLKKTEIDSKLKRMLLLDQDIDLKKKMIEYYDFGQIMKMAGPAVGILNKFAKRGNAAVKSASGVKGVSSKFTPKSKYNSSSSWNSIQSTEF
jgi:hypothetical protein